MDPAYAHYTVERETVEEPATAGETLRNVGRYVSWRFRGGGSPRNDVNLEIALEVQDVVRIREPSGKVVFERVFAVRKEGKAFETRLMSGLLDLDVWGSAVSTTSPRANGP